MKYSVCILANETSFDHELWIESIKRSDKVDSFDIVNLSSNDWFNQLINYNYDILLLRPPGRTELFKRLYDERILLISQSLNTPVYPSLNEVLIYENKRYLRDWLVINKLPHPATFIFFDKNEAMQFVFDRKTYPLVAKTNIGASGSGVVILEEVEAAIGYIENAFTNGISIKKGPKLFKGSFLKKLVKLIKYKGFINQKIKDYAPSALSVQSHFVIFQEYISHEFEWRCVRIGGSYFAHKKIARRGKASGHLIKDYDNVPLKLLDFIRSITNNTGLSSVAIDVFEYNDEYLINEIQCFFGQSDPYQMLVDGIPGRYVFENGRWNFEKGMFNTNQSFDLRLEHALSLLKEKSTT